MERFTLHSLSACRIGSACSSFLGQYEICFESVEKRIQTAASFTRDPPTVPAFRAFRSSVRVTSLIWIAVSSYGGFN